VNKKLQLSLLIN